MNPFGLMLAMCESLSERQALSRYSPTAIISGVTPFTFERER